MGSAIKKVFDANGIKFAFWAVQRAGEAEGASPAAAVIAKEALQLILSQAAE